MESTEAGRWLFWLVATLLLVVTTLVVMRKRNRKELHQDSISRSAPLDILNEQLVRGEITPEEHAEQVSSLAEERRRSA